MHDNDHCKQIDQCCKDYYNGDTVPLNLNLTLASIYSRALTPSDPSSSQQMLVSKGNMLLCMILLAIEFDTLMQLLTHIIVQSVDAPKQDYMLLCIILLAILLDAR